MKNKTLFIITFIIFLLDRVTKWLILHFGIFYFPLISHIISINTITNTGAAFSLFERQQLFLIILSSIAICYLFSMFIKRSLTKLQQIAWGLLLGGAISNLFDRLSFNCVIDFIHLDFINFPVFNIADSAITIGAIMIFYYYLFLEGKNNA